MVRERAARHEDPVTGDVWLRAGGTLSCNRQAYGQLIEASVALETSALPWGHVLAYTSTLDGQRWIDETHSHGWGGSPADGFGGTRIYRLCDDTSKSNSQQFAAGRHSFVITARIPGTDVTFSTPPVDVELYCAGEEPTTDSAVRPARSNEAGCNTAPGHSGFAAGVGSMLLFFGLWRRTARRSMRC